MDRKYHIDFLKVVLIFLVILGHMNSPFSKIIFSFHMPMFFFLSGMLLNVEKDFSARIKNDFNRLLIPFFGFAILGLVVEISKRLALGRSLTDFFAVLDSAFVHISSNAHYYGFVLWFLPALFLAKSFTAAALSVKNYWTGIIGYAASIAAILFFIDVSSLPFAVGQAIQASFFVLFGFCSTKLSQKFYLSMLSGCILYLLFFIMSGASLPDVDMGQAEMNGSLFALGITIAIPLAAVISASYMNFSALRNVLVFLASQTMLLFIFHPYTNNVAYLVVKKIGISNGWALQLPLSLGMLGVLVFIKERCPNNRLFKYV